MRDVRRTRQLPLDRRADVNIVLSRVVRRERREGGERGRGKLMPEEFPLPLAGRVSVLDRASLAHDDGAAGVRMN